MKMKNKELEEYSKNYENFNASHMGLEYLRLKDEAVKVSFMVTEEIKNNNPSKAIYLQMLLSDYIDKMLKIKSNK